MEQQVIIQLVGVAAMLYMFGSIVWFFRGIQKDDREINKDWYKRHNM